MAEGMIAPTSPVDDPSSDDTPEEAWLWEHALIQAAPELLHLIHVTPLFLSYLRASLILPDLSQETIEAGATNHDKVNKMLDHICQDVGHRFRSLLVALTETDQPKAVEIIERHVARQRESVMPPPSESTTESTRDILKCLQTLRNCQDDLERKMVVDISLIVTLRTTGVINQKEKEALEAKSTNHERVRCLLDIVCRDVKTGFVPFCTALEHTGQSGVQQTISELKRKQTTQLSPRAVRREIAKLSKPCYERNTLPEDELLEGIKDQCRYYMREILRVPQLDINHDEVHDINRFLVQLRVQKKERKAGTEELDPIDEADIFNELEGEEEPPVTVLLSGAPGQGKSTFIKSYIRKRSEQQLKRETPLQQVMVYIPAHSIEQDFWAAIEQNIHCRTQQRKEALLKFIKSASQQTFLFVDGTDELREVRSIQNLQEFIREARSVDTYRVLVSTRDNISNVQQSEFHRHIHVQGYTHEQGLEYIQNYLHDDKFAEQISKIRNLEKSHNISGILTNPLRNHMLCILTVNNCIDVTDVGQLNIGHLYKALDEMVIEREGKAKCLTDHTRFQMDKNNFYLMALFSML